MYTFSKMHYFEDKDETKKYSVAMTASTSLKDHTCQTWLYFNLCEIAGFLCWLKFSTYLKDDRYIILSQGQTDEKKPELLCKKAHSFISVQSVHVNAHRDDNWTFWWSLLNSEIHLTLFTLRRKWNGVKSFHFPFFLQRAHVSKWCYLWLQLHLCILCWGWLVLFGENYYIHIIF